MQRVIALVILVVAPMICLSADKTKKVKFPRQDDETSLARIKENVDVASEKSVIICGYVTVSDYFYIRTMREICYSMQFDEAGEFLGDVSGAAAHLYVLKSLGKSAYDEINAAPEKVKVVRAEVKRRSEWNRLDVVDLQFYEVDAKKWTPWLIRTAQEEAEKARAAEAKRVADEKAAAEDAAKTKKANDEKAAKEKDKSNEKKAASRLAAAKTILKSNKATGRKKLEEIIADHPDTNAAREARKLLDEK